MESFQCNVTTIYFPKKGQPQPENGFAIIAATLKGKGTVKLKGSMPGVRAKSTIRVCGQWSRDNYGEVFLVSRYEEVMPSSTEGIKAYLRSGLIRGIGPATAELIVNAFGENTITVLDESPERLYEVKGLGRKKVETITECWAEQKGIREVMVFLKNYDVPDSLAAKIYKHYREESIFTIRTRPYDLCEEIEGVGFQTVDRMALSMGVPRTDEGRLKAGVMYTMSNSCNMEGHSYLMKESLVVGALELLGNDIPADAVGHAVEVLSMTMRLTCMQDGRVYLPAFLKAEETISGKVAALLRTEETLDSRVDFTALEKECALQFETVQKQAIQTVFSSHMSIITGGPGTGKTTTVRGIIAQADIREMNVLLAAPTGRAAKRLAESTGLEAQTIHRLLEYSPADSAFLKDEKEPLEGDLLVVDECSMLDIMVTQALMKAVPDSMRAVFVGDIDQLPSVGPGNILRDLIDCGRIPTIRLQRIFRQSQDSLIITNAHAINHGQMPLLQGDLRDAAQDFCFVPYPTASTDPAGVQAYLLELVAQRIPDIMGYPDTDNIQVLSPMRKGPLGTVELNRLLQQRLNPDGKAYVRGAREYRIGDRVMQTRNDYENGVFNGETGKVTGVDCENHSVTVDFDGNEIEIIGEKLENLDLAYCMTIHKSQGSEYPVVVIPMVGRHQIMLVRNLLYTAVTRARRKCIIIGEATAVQTAVQNNTVRRRNSSLQERILEKTRV